MNPKPTLTFGIVIAFSLMLVAALTFLPTGVAIAQDEPAEAVPLLLGEYVAANMVNGETADYVLTLPEDASYEIGIVDEDEAIAFDLIVTDAEGNELFNDIFGSIDLELEAGDVNLHFEAVDNARLEFAILGNIGNMTTDIDQPGTLPAGGIFFSEDVSDPVYAALTIPETPYPQQVTVYFEPGAEDSFYVSVEGDDIGYIDAEATESDLLRFWTHGGEFLITAEPYERRSQLQLIPFLSGPPVVLGPDESIEDFVTADESAVIYSLPLTTPFNELTVEIEAALADIDITLVDRLFDGKFIESSYGEPTLTVENIAPGEYYLIIDTYDPVEEDLPLTVSVTGSAGDPIELLEKGDTVDGLFEDGESDVTFFLDVEEPGSLISVALVSAVAESDYDLEAGINLDLPVWSTFTIGSEDKMSFVAPVAGRYFVRVLSNGTEGDFALVMEDKGVAPAININELTWGSVGEGEESAYRLEIPETGGLLSIALVGPQEVDLDLRLAGYDEEGSTLAYGSSYSIGSAEIVSSLMEEPGIYEIVVSAEFSDGGDYVLLARLEDPNLIAGQFATEAQASSQFGDEGYAATQAAGEPNTPTAGDFDTSWASEIPESGEQTLELTYANSIIPHAINIHETYNPGAVIAVEAYDAEAGEWVSLWEGEAEAVEEPMRVFSPELTEAEFATDLIRLVLDTDAVEGWNEIDAVELLGRP